MATHLIQDTTLSLIADAIRLKAGKSEAFTPAQMVSEIEAIPSGGSTERENGLVARTLSSYENSTATEVGSYAFYSCSLLQSVDLPNVSHIGSSAFYNCSSLQSVNLPNVSHIGSSAFNCCYSLQSINLPNVSHIEYGAFRFCSSLQSVNLPMVNYIGDSAFMNCTSLQSVNLPLASHIGSGAFNCCYSLQSINLPIASYIGASAFRVCRHLLSLYLGSTSVCPLAMSNAFQSTPIAGYTTSTGGVYGSIYVPASLYSDYIVANNWSYFSPRFVSVSPTPPTPTTNTFTLQLPSGDQTLTFDEGMTWSDYAGSSYNTGESYIIISRGYVNYYDVIEGVSFKVMNEDDTQEISEAYIVANGIYGCEY